MDVIHKGKDSNKSGSKHINSPAIMVGADEIGDGYLDNVTNENNYKAVFKSITQITFCDLLLP